MYQAVSSFIGSRLPRYYSYMEHLMEKGRKKVSSRELSALVNSSSSQVRQDLSFLGNFGTRGYGYPLDYLHTEIGNAIGVNRNYELIVVGAGHLGQAIANYSYFGKYGFSVKGVFDFDSRLFGLEMNGMTVQSMNQLETFICKENIQIAALTVSDTIAKGVADRLVKAGIRGIWNFTYTDLEMPADVVVENVHLLDSLMQLSYREKEIGKESYV